MTTNWTHLLSWWGDDALPARPLALTAAPRLGRLCSLGCFVSVWRWPQFLWQHPDLVSIYRKSCHLLAGPSAALVFPCLRKPRCVPRPATDQAGSRAAHLSDWLSKHCNKTFYQNPQTITLLIESLSLSRFAAQDLTFSRYLKNLKLSV